MRRSTLNIEVEIDSGSLIDNAFEDATKLANKLGCTVRFKFNDVTCLANCGGDWEKGARTYHEANQSGKKFKFAIN